MGSLMADFTWTNMAGPIIARHLITIVRHYLHLKILPSIPISVRSLLYSSALFTISTEPNKLVQAPSMETTDVNRPEVPTHERLLKGR